MDLGRSRANALGWPNCYTYTKAMAEALVDLRFPKLPHAVLRPSIVESALAFPFAGWNEGYNTCGPLAYLIGTWFKAMPAREKNPFDVIPVDQVVNGLMIAGARLLEGDAPTVFQCGSSHLNRLARARARAQRPRAAPPPSRARRDPRRPPAPLALRHDGLPGSTPSRSPT